MSRIMFWLLLCTIDSAKSFDCRAAIEDTDFEYIYWPQLQHCLEEVNSESMLKNISAHIWRLVKASFDGMENIPPEVYLQLRYTLTAIPNDELRNISMEQVEVVEAFGAVRNTKEIQGFSDEQMRWLAEKVRMEWVGKNPHTYSQYDIMSLGEIVCHLNITDIANLHADVLKDAAEWVGSIEKCPQAQLNALAQLAMRHEAFGPTNKWSKLDVNIVGNIINGLPHSDLAAIEKDKLLLNRFYTDRINKYTGSRGSNNADSKPITSKQNKT